MAGRGASGGVLAALPISLAAGDEPIERHAGDIGDGAQMACRHLRPAADGGMRDAAGPGDPHDHAALCEDFGEDGITLHARMLSDVPTNCKRPVAGKSRNFLQHRSGFPPHTPAMPKLCHDDIARRLKAARVEMRHHPRVLAELLGTARSTYLGWEAGSRAKKPNFPSEEAMIRLCEIMPGLTLDYLYRGRLDTMRTGLAIRLLAREMGLDPDAADFNPAAVAGALAGAQQA
jgi:transcriptional regulator with XRE-family HTH domain